MSVSRNLPSAFSDFTPATMIFLISVIMTSFICLPATTDTTMVAFNFHINHQNDPAPAVAITMYDLHGIMYALPKATSSRNNSPASLMTTILHMMTSLDQYQCFPAPEEVNNISCNSSHLNVPRTTHSSFCRNKSMDNAAASLRQMITIMFFCHNIYLHLRFLTPSEDLSNSTSIRPTSVASCRSCNNICDDPCTCIDERHCLLLDDYYPMLLHMFAFNHQRDLKTISE